MCGGVLERGEGYVLLETLGKVLGSLRIKLVLAEAVNKEITQVSAAADTCMSVICGQEGRLAAYSSVWRVEFALRPSERCLAASTLRLLPPKLPTGGKQSCQRLLTRRGSYTRG